MAAVVPGMLWLAGFLGGVDGRADDAGRTTGGALRVREVVIGGRRGPDGDRDAGDVVAVIGLLDDMLGIDFQFEGVVAVGHPGNVNPLAVQGGVIEIAPTPLYALIAARVSGRGWRGRTPADRVQQAKTDLQPGRRALAGAVHPT